MKTKSLKIPGVGRVQLAHEPSGEGSGLLGVTGFDTNLTAQITRQGETLKANKVMSRWGRFWGNIKGEDTLINLGSGLVTNVGVLAMANEYAWANPGGTINTILGLSNYHATGTGTTAAAATDLQLQTVSTHGGQTPATGTQSLVSAANSQAYKTVGTLSYNGTEAVTEWGLFTNSTLSSTTGSPFTATTATGFTATGTPFTASSSTVAGEQFQVVFPGTTTVWGLVLSNTTSAGTIPAWYKVADGTAGSTPGATETYTLRPVMWDHKVFSALNVVSGDSITFTYTLTINSGG